MALIVGAALLTAIALLLLLRPLLTRRAPDLASGDDREVYAAQLDEIEADKARGLIRDADAQAARAEIARRLLRAGGPVEDGGDRKGARVGAVMAVIVFVPVFSAGAYFLLGAPDYADQPLAARLAPVNDEDIPRLLARAEERLAENPDDARGWLAVAPIYQRLRRFGDAANAYGRVNAILGENAEFLAAQGENLAFANAGAVTPPARALFERALALAPEAIRPAIFLAIADRQAGDMMAAAERWRALLARSDGTEPWLQIATAEFSRMGGVPGSGETAEPGSEGPRIPSNEAARSLSGSAAAEPSVPTIGANPPPQVEAMVARLATRLAQEGGSADEWARLVRSLTVLGRRDEARQATETALATLTGDARAAFRAAPDVQEYLP